MSHATTPSFPDFGKLVPGFDFLQNLTKQAAGSATQVLPQLPNLGNWIAPTINLEELDKRVQELKAVQFWLDQNAAALKATIQALEVQRMTLATLKGMNFNMGEVANAFKLKVTESMMGGAPKAPEKAKGFAGLEIPPSAFQTSRAQAEAQPEPAAKPAAPRAESGEAPAAAGVADPMQWWGALTQQFQTIAAEALKEVAKTTHLDAGKNIATGMAKDAVKTATDMATGLAKGMAQTASKTMTSSWPKPAAAKDAAPAPKKAAARTGAAKTAAAKPAAKAAVKAKPQAPARKAAGTAARKATR
ncbi:MAG: hypothetical protein I8H71_11220 [Xanthomonadaceae bacterium]|nr:hypothetical protein [Xanthomonadaceae bacterium]